MFIHIAAASYVPSHFCDGARWSVGPDDNMLVVPTKNNMLWEEQHKKTGDINVLRRKRRSSGCFSSVFTIFVI